MEREQVIVMNSYAVKQLLIDALRLFTTLGCTENTECDDCCLVNLCDPLSILSSDLRDEIGFRSEVE